MRIEILRRVSALLILIAILPGCTSQTPVTLQGHPIGNIYYCKAAGNGSSVTDIYSIGANGKDQKLIAHLDSSASNPMWSPDGSLIAFDQDVSGSRAIVVVDAAGGNKRVISESHRRARAPAWSPDGGRIAYYCWDPDSPEYTIHVTGLDRREDHRIGTSAKTQTYPFWSPDGKKLVFHTAENKSTWDVATMNADGTEFKKLTEKSGKNWLPAYSPDGTKIAFWSDRIGHWELYTMDSDGSNIRQLTANNPLGPLAAGVPRAVWSPDGSNLVFTSSDLLGKVSLYMLDLNGHQLKIADNVGDICDWRGPDFQPSNKAHDVFTIGP